MKKFMRVRFVYTVQKYEGRQSTQQTAGEEQLSISNLEADKSIVLDQK